MDFVELLYSGSKHIWLEKVEPKMFFVCLEPLIGAVINKTLIKSIRSMIWILFKKKTCHPVAKGYKHLFCITKTSKRSSATNYLNGRIVRI